MNFILFVILTTKFTKLAQRTLFIWENINKLKNLDTCVLIRDTTISKLAHQQIGTLKLASQLTTNNIRLTIKYLK